jgi:uncharacterized damage-inducible protein DinB
MTRSLRVAHVAAALLAAASAASASAQSLGRRIEGASGSTVQFSFASRPGVCGDGKTYIRTDTDSWYGSFNDYTRSQPCEAGPVRVVVVKAGSEVIKLEPYAGPVQVPTDVTDLGRVSSADAVAYLGTLVAVMPSWIAMAITRDELDVHPKEGEGMRPEPWTTNAELLAQFEKSSEMARSALAGASDAYLATPWNLLASGKVVDQRPRHEVIADTLCHAAHHPGQLSVYLRLMEIAVPSIYGPSADDKVF